MKTRWILAALALALAPLPIKTAEAAGPLPGIDSSSGFVIYYGADFSPATMATLARADVVVLHPEVHTVTPSIVAELQAAGVDQVLGYISLGEEDGDLPVMVGDGTGPVRHDGVGLVTSGGGVASFYVDDFYDGTAYVSDGIPDTNPEWGGRYILPNAAWRDVLEQQRMGGSTAYPTRDAAGLGQLLGARDSETDTDRTHDFGFDGVFLDTIGTASPYLNVPGSYSWAAEEMSVAVASIAEDHPDATLMVNGGGFYFNPTDYNPVYDVHPFDFSIRPYVSAVLFESYRLDRYTGTASYFHPDNRHNYAPKMIAESMREDGFTVFTVDYAESASTAELDATLVASAVDNGWTPYIAPDIILDDAGTYALDNPPAPDLSPPVWDSTASGFALIDVPDRVGVQSVVLGDAPGEIIVGWDVARDQTGPVTFNVAISSAPDMSNAVVFEDVQTRMGDGWDVDPFSAGAFETTVGGLSGGDYYVRVRAVDGLGQSEENDVVLPITMPGDDISNVAPALVLDGVLDDWDGLVSFGIDPDDLPAVSDAYDLLELWMADGDGMLYVGMDMEGPYQASWRNTVYFDVDETRMTGYRGYGNLSVGAEYMLQGRHVYAYTGSGTNWSWSWIGKSGGSHQGGDGEFTIPLAWLGDPAAIDVVFKGNATPKDYAPDGADQGAGGEAYHYAIASQ
ncbi:MAG: hypothetical protein AAGA54_06995 [Myxococcota bacterium]